MQHIKSCSTVMAQGMDREGQPIGVPFGIRTGSVLGRHGGSPFIFRFGLPLNCDGGGWNSTYF